MFLKINSLLASSVLMVSTAAIAQTTPTQPVQPTTGHSHTAPGQTQTTPGQSQTTPGEASENTPATTGVTPSGQTTASAQAAQITPATEADFKKGVKVRDQTGELLGTIDSSTSSSAVVSTGKVRASIPLASFGRGENGLVLGMSKSEFEAAAAAAAPKKTK